jgi:hypothetical protein
MVKASLLMLQRRQFDTLKVEAYMHCVSGMPNSISTNSPAYIFNPKKSKWLVLVTLNAATAISDKSPTTLLAMYVLKKISPSIDQTTRYTSRKFLFKHSPPGRQNQSTFFAFLSLI